VSRAELDHSYERVERRLALSGSREGVPWLPDSVVATELTPSKDEGDLARRIRARWPGVRPVAGRFAQPLAAMEAAAATGRLLCRQGAVVKRIHVDNASRVTGVSWLDEETRTERRTNAPLVFLCASALESTRILMMSSTPNSPGGLGDSSGVLGRNLMDHLFVKLEGEAPAMLDPPSKVEIGPCVYLPRFDARCEPAPSSSRGFGVQVYQYPAGWNRSYFLASSFGEMLPHRENRVSLDSHRQDAWGIPVLKIDCRHTPAEIARAREQAEALRELAAALDVTSLRLSQVPAEPGASVHECGTARMGDDPADSVLDPYNECWEARGLYVTDGASFPSQGCQNPTLTIMALTERACGHALRRSVALHEEAVDAGT
jgi:choline dehydrogenase-like flavoprotein